MAYPPTNNHTDGTGEAWDALMANEQLYQDLFHLDQSKQRSYAQSVMQQDPLIFASSSAMLVNTPADFWMDPSPQWHCGGLTSYPPPPVTPSPTRSQQFITDDIRQPPRSTPMIRKSFVQHSPLRSKRANRKSSTYTRWTPEEDELLRQAVALHGPHKWSLIASHVPNRTPMQCSTRWLGALNPNIHKGRWTEHEDAVLRYAYMEFAGIPDGEGGFQPIPWNRIAERIPNRTGIQCQARWTEALDPSVRKGKWSEAEDALLRAGVDKFGRCWIRIAETVPGRTQRQCRTRWMQIKSKEDKLQGKKSPCKRPACPTPMDDAAELSSCASTEPDSSLDFAAADSSLQHQQQHNTFRLLDDLSMFDPQHHHHHHHPYQDNKMATPLDLLPTSGSGGGGGATPTTAESTMAMHHDNNAPALSTTSTAAAAAAAMTEDPSSLFASF